MRRNFHVIRFLLLASLLFPPAVIAKEVHVDVAPFGQPLAGENFVGLEWPEMRRIARVYIAFAQDGARVPAASEMQVQYWHRVWNGAAIRRYADHNAGSTGWTPVDDWFNGEWKTADTEVRMEDRTATFTFASSELKEFPGLNSPGVTYRPTLKIRVVFSGAHPRVETLRASTDSTWRRASLAIHFENRDRCDDPIEIYNGQLVSKQASEEGGECVQSATLSYFVNPDDPEADRTIVTVRSPSHPFSFAADEAERADRIFVKDFGVLVTRSDDPITIAEYRRILEEARTKTVYERVKDHAEQTLSNAWNDMPLKRPYFFVLGCEGGRQRFRLDPNGDMRAGIPNFSTRRPGKDNGHFLWPGELVYRFGLPASPFADRFLAEGYLPIVTTRWLEGDLLYEQEAFADALAANLNTGPPMQGDDPTLAFLRLRILNNSSATQTARLTFTTESEERGQTDAQKFEGLRLEGDKVLGAFEGREVLRYLVDTRGTGRLSNSSAGVIYQIELAPHQDHAIFLKVPFITLTDEAEIGRLRTLSPERELEEVARYWRNRVAAGSEIRTPEPWLNDFYKAHATHLLINDEREIGSERYAARVGSFAYGVYGNESIMMVSDLDRRGYSKEAERSLELFLHYQGSVPLPGNFTSQQGVFYGAGGYEAGGYNQHHGWTLWGLAEHYWHTRDRAWMEHAAPHLVEACHWIINQRKGTEKLDAEGRRGPEYGLLPAGSLEDVTDFWYWISTNCFTWWGLSNAAAALEDFGHPEGAALVEEAKNYRQEILRAYREAMLRSPVVRLRDGTYVPKFPSNVYTRGRSYGWLRETLEGAIMLVITRVLDPNSPEAEWILKDYEDNLYISGRYGFSIPVFDQFWFSRGGFSMQPNLLHGPLPYLYRDEIKRFVRAYFNPFAAAFDPSLRMLCEHPLPELGYFVGDLFKPSDEAQSAYWLRLMFVAELGGTLHLGRGIPRYWLKDGETIGIRNASTYFGKLSYEIRSSAKAGKISMSLDPPTRNAPPEIIVRFRHPEQKPIRRVFVNDHPWEKFDAANGDIHLPGETKAHAEIVAEY